MSATESNQQDEEKPVTNEINIKVKDQRGTAICFKMKRSIKLKKLMQTYCARNGYPQNSVRFLYEGEEIRETDTPEGLKMEDGDMIEIDIIGCKINLLVSDEEIAKRKKNFKMVLKPVTGYLSRYRKLVTSASTGAIFED